MKITSNQLEQLIKEEIDRQLVEASFAQRFSSLFTGKPTDDDVMKDAADEILHKIDAEPPLWNALYDKVYFPKRLNPKALKMALEDKLMKMPLTSEVAEKHGIDTSAGGLRSIVRLMIDELISFLKIVHETREKHHRLEHGTY